MLFPPLGIPLVWFGREGYDTKIGVTGVTVISGLILTLSLARHPQTLQIIEETVKAFSPTSSAVAAPKPLPPVKTRFTKADFGAQWPFTLDEGQVDCIPISGKGSLGAAIFRTNSGIYALNEIATSRASLENYKNLGDIWKDDPQLPGTKMSALAIIQAGSAVCQQKAE